MYTDNSSGSRLFILLSLLSTGLSIVAAGLLVDYSSRLLNQSQLLDARSGDVAADVVRDTRRTDHRWMSGRIDAVLVQTFTAGGPADGGHSVRADAIGRSILLDGLRDEISRRVEVVPDPVHSDLIVLEPAAPDVRIRGRLIHGGPRAVDVVPRRYRQGLGG